MLLNMRDLLKVAHTHRFAIPAFNISSNMLLGGVMEASEEMNSPVILAIHPDELHFVRTSFVKAALEEAVKASVPVCIHLDHGSSLGQIMEAIQCGFTSVMIDASTLPLADNIAISRQVVELAHAVNVSVEGELGTIGTTGPEAEAGSEEIIYTNPDDVVIFVESTQVDTLAVAIGTSHGIYPKNKKPELKLALLQEIAARVDIPLVLHGGSANPENEIAAAVQRHQRRVLSKMPPHPGGPSPARAQFDLSALHCRHERGGPLQNPALRRRRQSRSLSAAPPLKSSADARPNHSTPSLPPGRLGSAKTRKARCQQKSL